MRKSCQFWLHVNMVGGTGDVLFRSSPVAAWLIDES